MFAVINGITDTRSDLYGNPILYILAGLMLQFAIVTISKFIGSSRWLSYIGRRTLSILVMHKFPIMFLKLVVPGFNTMINEGVVWAEVLSSIVTVILCLIADYIIMRIAPVLCGKNNG